MPITKSADGTVPVVYQIDLRDPASLFVTQNFPVQNRDVIYVANSPEAEFNKFLRLVVSIAVPTVTLNKALSNHDKCHPGLPSSISALMS